MASHLIHSSTAGAGEEKDQLYSSTTTTDAPGVSLADITKTNNFTSKLPPDAAFDTPLASHNAPREHLGPRLVKGALYTFVRPETTYEPELLAVSPRAMKDIGLKEGEDKTDDFREMVAGNKIFWNETDGGVYPWAQCYGGKALFLGFRTIFYFYAMKYTNPIFLGWQLYVFLFLWHTLNKKKYTYQ